MKTTIKALVNADSTIARLAEKELPVNQSYRLAKFIKAFVTEFDVYNAERIKLCNKYGTLDKDNGVYKFEGESREKFNADINVLLSQEVELDVKPIDISGLELSAQDIISIEPFIEVTDDD